MIKQIKEEDWFEIGEYTREASHKLCKLMKESEGKLPPHMMKQLENTMKELSKFKKAARNLIKITGKDVMDYYFSEEMKKKDR